MSQRDGRSNNDNNDENRDYLEAGTSSGHFSSRTNRRAFFRPRVNFSDDDSDDEDDDNTQNELIIRLPSEESQEGDYVSDSNINNLNSTLEHDHDYTTNYHFDHSL